MDINEYIASGIIERYALGNVSTQEKQEVECMSHIYPEIKQELSAVQQSLERLAIKGAVAPPSHVKAAILKRIKTEKQLAPQEKEAKVISLNASREASSRYKYAMAASVAVVIALSLYTYTMRGESASVKNELAESKQTIEVLNQEKNTLETTLTSTNDYLTFIKDEATTKIMMSGTEAHPGMLATVFWNKSSKEVMLEINNLPEPPSDMQYQLWAIVDGTPQDMGVLEMSTSLIGMKPTSSAQAFAITLEPKGGSVSPTLEQMYVLGKV